MSGLETLISAAKPWATFYGDSKVVSSACMFAHISGMMWGGGLALYCDRAVWKLRAAAADERTRLLADIGRVHGAVILGLAISALSGVAMFLADVSTYGPSPSYWAKMAAFALLLLNGAWLRRQERRMQQAPATMATGWRLLSTASALSFTLWFTVALGGVILTSL